MKSGNDRFNQEVVQNMEIKIVTFLVLLLIAILAAVKVQRVNKDASKYKQALKLVKTDDKVKSISVGLQDRLLIKTASLLAQSEYLDELKDETPEAELLRIMLSFRLERRANIEQLKALNLVDMSLAKNRLINN